MKINKMKLFAIVMLLNSFNAIAIEKDVDAKLIGSLPAAPSGYKWLIIKELSDEFDNDTLDLTKWNPLHPYWKGREPSKFSPNNVMLKAGCLELRSSSIVNDLTKVPNPNKDFWVNAACISSKMSIAFYGYYQARVKSSRLSMTSAFWLQGKYSEIDVIENLGASAKYPESGMKMLMNTHYFSKGWENDKNTSKEWKLTEHTSDNFQVYGVWWIDKDNIWMYHNGVKVAEFKTGGEFLEKMYLFFDTEVFTWHGIPSIESLNDSTKNTMQVDWVRSWQLISVN